MCQQEVDCLKTPFGQVTRPIRQKSRANKQQSATRKRINQSVIA